MKTKLIKKKKSKTVGIVLLTLSAITGACVLCANSLRNKRKKLLKKADTVNKSFTPSKETVAGGCEKMGQNEAIPGKTNINSTSPEWERGVS